MLKAFSFLCSNLCEFVLHLIAEKNYVKGGQFNVGNSAGDEKVIKERYQSVL